MKVYAGSDVTIYEHNGKFYPFDGVDLVEDMRETVNLILENPDMFCYQDTLADAGDGYEEKDLKVVYEI